MHMVCAGSVIRSPGIIPAKPIRLPGRRETLPAIMSGDKALKREANRQARMARRQERRARVRARFEQVKINVRGAIGSKAREAQEKKRAREIEDARPLTKFWWKEGIAKPRHWIIEADQDPGKVMRGVEAAYTSAST
jgi:hypothetical protein